MSSTDNPTQLDIEEILQTVYDPEFPYLDIFNMWLIYTITVLPEQSEIVIDMTLTSPACPAADFIVQNIKDAITVIHDAYTVIVTIEFDPPWTPDMIKDEDLKRMFE